jgi:hypothetical protein
MNIIKIGHVRRDITGRYYPIMLDGKWINEISEYEFKHVDINWRVLGRCFKYLKDAKKCARDYYSEVETFEGK